MWDGDDLLGLPHFPTLWSWFSSIQLKIYLFTLSIHILHKKWQWNSISYPMIFHSIIPEINHPAFLGYSHDYANNHIYFFSPSSIKYHTYSIFQWYLMIFMEPPHIFHWSIHAHRRWRQELMSGQDGVFTRLDRFQEGAKLRIPGEAVARKELWKIWGDGRLTIGIVIGYTIYIYIFHVSGI